MDAARIEASGQMADAGVAACSDHPMYTVSRQKSSGGGKKVAINGE